MSQKSVPAFVKPGFEVLGYQNPVGVLRLVLSVKDFEAMKFLFLAVARQVAEDRPDESSKGKRTRPKAVSVTTFPDHPDLLVEMDLSAQGWEILYLREMAKDRVLQAIESKSPVPLDEWLLAINEATKASSFVPRWAHGDDALRRCGQDWIRHLIAPSLEVVRLPVRATVRQKKGPIKAVRPAGKVTPPA